MTRNHVITMRVDIRTVGSLLRFYELQGLHLTSLSEAINQALEDYMTALVSNGLAARIDDINVALVHVQAATRKPLNTRTATAIARSVRIDTQQQLETAESEITRLLEASVKTENEKRGNVQ